MNFFQLVWILIVGLIVGIVARILMPGQQHMHLWACALFGVVGSFVGGAIGSLVKKPKEGTKFHPAGFAMSVVGTIVVIAVARMLHIGVS